MILDLLFESPELYFSWVLVTILSIVLHELGHALVATWEGDPTPGIRGHLTWKPWVHMGWMSILLVAAVGIGWGLTPVTPSRFRHRRWGSVFVSFAGPAVNLLLAVLGVAMLALLHQSSPDAPQWMLMFWWFMGFRNIALFVLNMIPVPPLDGFSVIDGIFDLGELGDFMKRTGSLGFIVLIVLLNLPGSPFSKVVFGILEALSRLLGARVVERF